MRSVNLRDWPGLKLDFRFDKTGVEIEVRTLIPPSVVNRLRFQRVENGRPGLAVELLAQTYSRTAAISAIKNADCSCLSTQGALWIWFWWGKKYPYATPVRWGIEAARPWYHAALDKGAGTWDLEEERDKGK